MTIAIDLFGNDTINYSTSKWDKIQQDTDKPYCRIYQLKVTEVLTYNRYRREQQARINREKLNVTQSIDYRLNEQRLHKEYMNHVRERTKAHTQNVLATYRKKTDQYSVKPKQPIALSITPSNFSALFEPRSKCASKMKLTPLLTRPERIKSPSVSSEKSLNKSKLIPIMKNSEIEEDLSTANQCQFTEATSSSRTHHSKSQYSARQSLLDTIMLHLKSYGAEDITKGPNYQDIKYKFASSISPHVYESFERMVVEDTFDCTDHDDDSFHPMYSTDDCRHYWHCIYVGTSYMRAVKRVCPAGTQFDIFLKECEISSLVDCVKLKSTVTSRTSTKRYTHLLTQKSSTVTNNQHRSSTKHLILQQLKVLPTTSSFSFEQLIKRLNAMVVSSSTIDPKISNVTNESKYSLTSEQTGTIDKDIFLTSTINQNQTTRYDPRREHIMINILTSNEHKIRKFSLNQTHGILIHCNEVRRRQLRDLIFRTTTRTTTTTYSLKMLNSSLKIFHHDILSLKIFIMSFLFLQKISD